MKKITTFFLRRLFSNTEETLGILADNKVLCWTLEDEFRAIKVMKETRIPAGTYELMLRTFGTHHERYLRKFGKEFHKGMIQLKDVRNFTDILIHIGNTEVDTAGCLLVGSLAAIENNRYTILNSTKAYKYVYPLMANPLYAGEQVFLKVTDE